MVLDTARPKYKENNAWKRFCKKVDSRGEHFTCIHDRFFRDPVYRESQLAIGWSQQESKEWDGFVKEDHIQTHSRGKEKILRTKISFSEQSRQKWVYEVSI